MPNEVEAYWTEHTVNDTPFASARESLAYLQWRSDVYPLAYEMMNLYGNHSGETVLDFGCGPGNDLVGFLAFSGAKKVTGVDVSPKALRLARRRIKLHRFGRERCKLILAKDDGTIDLPSSSVDHVNCQGVLHHVSNPKETLSEFYRVLKPGGTATIMVYNYDSLFLHLYVAYDQQILQGTHAGLSAKDAFAKLTDGDNCPIAIAYKPSQFVAICQSVGFRVQYKGGYFADIELALLRQHGYRAVLDERLDKEHREFIRGLGWSGRNYPLHDLVTAGVGGVYLLSK